MGAEEREEASKREGWILSDHGNRPQNAVASMEEDMLSWTPKGLFRRFAHPPCKNKTGQQDRHDITYTIPYSIAKHGAQHRRHPPNTETRKGGFRGPPRGGGRTQAPKGKRTRENRSVNKGGDVAFA